MQNSGFPQPAAPERPGVQAAQPRAVPRVGVVLAAGRSQRLHQVTGGESKALVHLGGMRLVERAVRTLLNSGIQQVLVVVGHNAGTVAAVVGRIAPGRVRAVHAEAWERGNGASLSAVRHALAGEDLFALITADHVFGEGALEHLLAAGEPAALVDPVPEASAWQEGTRVRLTGGVAVAFGKELDDQVIDCGAFLLPQEVFHCQQQAAARGDDSLAGALTRLARIRSIRVVPIRRASWWQDIDSPADLARARIQLRRSLIKPSDGPISRYLNRPISTRLSMAIAPLRFHPDLLSLIAFAVGLVGAAFLVDGRGILGGVFAQLASILDGVDGEVARLNVRAGPRGALLDGVLDRLADSAILAGLGVWALGEGFSPTMVLTFAVGAATGAALSMASKDRVAALGLPRASERLLGYLLGGRDGRLFIVGVGSVFGLPLFALAAVAATAAVTLILRVWLVRRHADRARL